MTEVFERIRDSIAVILIFTQLNLSSCQTYNGRRQGYTSVPTDIPDGTEKSILIIMKYLT